MSTSKRDGRARHATPATRGESERYHHGDLARSLVEAARDLVGEGGAAAVSLREAARRAGVSHNAPYRHFESREALLAAVARQGFADFAEALRAAAEAAPSSSDGSRARLAMGVAYVRFALDHRGLHRLMFSDAVDRSAFPDLAEAARAAFAVIAEKYSEPGGDTGDGASQEGAARRRRLLALRAWATVHGLAQLLLDGELPEAGDGWSSPEELVEAVVTA